MLQFYWYRPLDPRQWPTHTQNTQSWGKGNLESSPWHFGNQLAVRSLAYDLARDNGQQTRAPNQMIYQRLLDIHSCDISMHWSYSQRVDIATAHGYPILPPLLKSWFSALVWRWALPTARLLSICPKNAMGLSAYKYRHFWDQNWSVSVFYQTSSL